VLPAFVSVVVHALPQRGISVTGEYNALRHDCQQFSAAMRQKRPKDLKTMVLNLKHFARNAEIQPDLRYRVFAAQRRAGAGIEQRVSLFPEPRASSPKP
jgi:hypothetical protein